MICRKIYTRNNKRQKNWNKNRTKNFLLQFSFTLSLYTTKSLLVGGPWCFLQIGFTNFQQYKLVFLSFQMLFLLGHLGKDLLVLIEHSQSWNTCPNNILQFLLYSSFFVFFASILQALPSEVLFQVISKIFFKILNLPSHYSKCISKKNWSKLCLWGNRTMILAIALSILSKM